MQMSELTANSKGASGEEGYNDGKRWLMLAIVFFVGLFIFFNMFKAAPLLPILMQGDMGFTADNIGLMLSIFSIAGVLLAFPAGGIVGKLGIKTTMLISIVFAFAGTVLGAFSSDVVVMLISRLLEGIGYGLFGVLAPIAAAAIVKPQFIGLSQGVQSAAFPAATTLAMNLSPILFAATGSWQASWWVAAGATAVMFAVVLILFKLPPAPAHGGFGAKGADGAPAGDPFAGIKPYYLGIILVAVVFFLFNIVGNGALSNFYPTFLQEIYSMDIQKAGFITGLISLLCIVLSPAFGLLADKTGHRKWYLAISMAGMAVVMLFAFNPGNDAIPWLTAIASALLMSLLAPSVFALIPKFAKRPDKIGIGMATVVFFQGIGVVIGSALMMPLITATGGWTNVALYVLLPLCVIALAVALFIKEKQ